MVIALPFLDSVVKSCSLRENSCPILKTKQSQLNLFSLDMWFHQIWSIQGDCFLKEKGTMQVFQRTFFLAYPEDNYNSSCPKQKGTKFTIRMNTITEHCSGED